MIHLNCVLFYFIIELRFNCASVSFLKFFWICSFLLFLSNVYFVPSSYLQMSEGRRLFQLSTISWSICMFLSSDNYKLELSTICLRYKYNSCMGALVGPHYTPQCLLYALNQSGPADLGVIPWSPPCRRPPRSPRPFKEVLSTSV